jgi:mRNA interferase MazF
VNRPVDPTRNDLEMPCPVTVMVPSADRGSPGAGPPSSISLPFRVPPCVTAIPAYVAPCPTTTRGLPSELILDPSEDPIPRQSAINLDSVESVSIAVLVERIGRLADVRMGEVCASLEMAVDCGG